MTAALAIRGGASLVPMVTRGFSAAKGFFELAPEAVQVINFPARAAASSTSFWGATTALGSSALKVLTGPVGWAATIGSIGIEIASNKSEKEMAELEALNNGVSLGELKREVVDGKLTIARDKFGLPDVALSRELAGKVNSNDRAMEFSSNPELAARGVRNYQDPAYMERRLEESAAKIDAFEGRNFMQRAVNMPDLAKQSMQLEQAAAEAQLKEYRKEFAKWEQDPAMQQLSAAEAAKERAVLGALEKEGAKIENGNVTSIPDTVDAHAVGKAATADIKVAETIIEGVTNSVTGSKDSLNDRIAQNDHAVIKTLRDTLIAGGVRPEITDKIKIDEGKHISGVDSRDLRDKLEQYKKDGLTTAELDSFAKDVVTKIEGVKPPVAVDPTATVTPTPAAAPPTAASEPTK